MSRKMYCDSCGKEIYRNYDAGYAPSLMLDGFLCIADVKIRNNLNIDLCLKCLLKIVNEGKE